MKLKTYIQNNGLTWEQLGDRAGVSRQTVYNIIAKRHKPTLKVMKKIENATGGEVKSEDMVACL